MDKYPPSGLCESPVTNQDCCGKRVKIIAELDLTGAHLQAARLRACKCPAISPVTRPPLFHNRLLRPDDAGLVLLRQQHDHTHRPRRQRLRDARLQSMLFIDITNQFDRLHTSGVHWGLLYDSRYHSKSGFPRIFSPVRRDPYRSSSAGRLVSPYSAREDSVQNMM